MGAISLPPRIHEGRVALVTGASRGLGRQIALQLAEQGAFIVVNYRLDDGSAEETRKLIEETNGSAACIRADVSQASEVDSLFDDLLSRCGQLDILVNNAGVSVMKLLQQSTEEEWERVLATNLGGTFLCTKRALPLMRQRRWGRIINIGSAAGMMGGVGQSIYSASKAGLIGLTRSVAREAAPFGITVNLVAPGFMRTEMAGAAIVPKRAQQLIPVGRIGEIAEVAAAAVFLSAPLASYITGQQIFVDGGLSAS